MSAFGFLILAFSISCFGQAYTFRDHAWLGNLLQVPIGGVVDTNVNLTNSLQAYWRMDEIPVPDIIGSATLTPFGTFSNVTGLITNAVSSLGVSQDLGLTNSANGYFFGATHDFTVSTWVRSDAAVFPTNTAVFVDNGSFVTGAGFTLYFAGPAFALSAGDGSAVPVVSSFTTPLTNTWYNVVGRYSSTNQQLVINVQGTNYQDVWPFTGNLATNTINHISLFAPAGGSSDNFNNTYAWPGLMDDTAIWDRYLTDHEVEYLYTNGVQNHLGYAWTGGGGGGFSSPADYSPLAWYAADYAVTNTSGNAVVPNDPIDKVGDKSGNGNVLTSAVGINFVWKTNIQNGLPAFETAHDSYLDRATLTQGTEAQPLTVYFVGSHASAASYKVAFASYRGGGTTALWSSDANKVALQAPTLIAGSGGIVAGWQIFTVVFDGASTEAWTNGVSVLTGNAGTDSLIGFELLGHQPSAGIYWRDYFGECIVFSGHHDATQRSNVEGWLKARWGTP